MLGIKLRKWFWKKRKVRVGKEREKERKILECVPTQLWLAQVTKQ